MLRITNHDTRDPSLETSTRDFRPVIAKKPRSSLGLFDLVSCGGADRVTFPVRLPTGSRTKGAHNGEQSERIGSPGGIRRGGRAAQFGARRGAARRFGGARRKTPRRRTDNERARGPGDASEVHFVADGGQCNGAARCMQPRRD